MATYVTAENLTRYDGKIKQVIKDGDSLKNSITVELGANGSLGGYKTGDVIEEGTEVKSIIKKLLAKQIPPTYTAPTVSILNNNGTTPGGYEIGTTISPKMKVTYNQNDGGNLTSIEILSNVASGQTSPLTGEVDPFILETTTSYQGKVSYEAGPIKNDNLGEPYPTGSIAAGVKYSSNITFTPYRQGYFWGILNTSSLDTPLDSTIIRSCNKKNGAYSSGTISGIAASSVNNRKCIFIACPATNTGVTKVIMPSAMNADCTADFVKQNEPIMVEGLNGYTAIAYNVWIYEPAMISDDQTFIVTLG